MGQPGFFDLHQRYWALAETGKIGFTRQHQALQRFDVIRECRDGHKRRRADSA
ncbi:MAG: hypothetical protein K0R41_2553 [Geminicoccaceae bacterium]|nr:hypothetical protein [Geminicoccaceae bacterium]